MTELMLSGEAAAGRGAPDASTKERSRSLDTNCCPLSDSEASLRLLDDRLNPVQ